MGNATTVAMLRHLPNADRLTTGVSPAQIQLSAEAVSTIGRDPSCQIVIDSQVYGMVSRRHAEIRYVCATGGAQEHWWICDRNSANGTNINQQPLQGCQILQHGDRLTLGKDGPIFLFELFLAPVPLAVQSSMVPAGRVASVINPQSLVKTPDRSGEANITLTQLFPIFSSGLDLRRKAYLWPGAIVVTFVVAMFMAIDAPLIFNLLLASFLAIGCYYLIYLLCGKHKPAWVLVGTAISTVLLLQSPVLRLFMWFFRDILPGAITTDDQVLSFPVQLIGMFFGAGLMEELLKALPLFLILGLGAGLKPRQRNHWGIVEPLDGILLGAASAIGFTMIETLGQYVPAMVQDAQLQAGLELSQLRGLQLLIPRLLGTISGHMAYSGYFGYFIGLSVLRPTYRWQILIVGYVTASGLHALWNTMGGVSPVLLAIVGMLSYAFLAASIVKARSLSPNRTQNFATRLKD
jgi:RsiW-degrading membrane proteinase PrsW (M82 family)